MLKLYEIADQYRSLLELDDPDIPAEAIADTLEGLQGDLEMKARNVAAFFRNLEAEVEAMRSAEKRIADRRKVIERKIEAGREYLKTNMERAGITKITAPEFVLSIKKNPPSVEVVDEAGVPEMFWHVEVVETRDLDKKMIADALKGGIDVPGCRLLQKTRLEVK